MSNQEGGQACCGGFHKLISWRVERWAISRVVKLAVGGIHPKTEKNREKQRKTE